MATKQKHPQTSRTYTEPAAARSQKARVASLIGHATCDHELRSQRQRDARWATMERAVDPDGTLAPAERRRRAEAMMRARMIQVAAARNKPKTAAKLAEQCDWCALDLYGDFQRVPGGKTNKLCQRHHDEMWAEAIKRRIVVSPHTNEPQPAA